MVQLGMIEAELTILTIRFIKIMSFMLIYLDLLKARSFVFVTLFGNMVYCTTPFTCVLIIVSYV
jgi:hypothetical protein